MPVCDSYKPCLTVCLSVIPPCLPFTKPKVVSAHPQGCHASLYCFVPFSFDFLHLLLHLNGSATGGLAAATPLQMCYGLSSPLTDLFVSRHRTLRALLPFLPMFSSSFHRYPVPSFSLLRSRFFPVFLHSRLTSTLKVCFLFLTRIPHLSELTRFTGHPCIIKTDT